MKEVSEGSSHLPPQLQALLNPRKSPVQARSAASVDAILEATIQVLLDAGKDRLTTTKVALRAGVSVGTLYQYFPNKRSLLHAVLRRHLDGVTETVELVCREQRGNTLSAMATALVNSFLQAKLRDAKTSVALYSVSSDVDGAKIAQQLGLRSNQAIAGMLATAREPLTSDPNLMASMIMGAMAGVSRTLLESGDAGKRFDSTRQELVLVVRAYLEACCAKTAEYVGPQ